MLVKWLLSIVTILFNLFIVRYVYTLKNNDCECYENNKLKLNFVFGYACLTIALILIYYTIPISVTYFKKTNMFEFLAKGSVRTLFEIYLIAGLINLALIYNTTQKIVQSKCNCSDSLERKILYYYSITVFVIYIISFLVSIELYLIKK